MAKPKAVLIFGDPGAGKSWLGQKFMDERGYYLARLDNLYVSFVQERHPNMYLPDLATVISQHYRTILSDGAKKEWGEFVLEALLPYTGDVAIEGYLLPPILKTLRRELRKKYAITTIYVRDRRYYVESALKDILEGD